MDKNAQRWSLPKCVVCELPMLYVFFPQYLSQVFHFQLTICSVHRILNNHSTDKSLVEVLRRHYVPDHLFSDEHQERQLFRWGQRYSYVDSAFMERLKEELKEMVKKKVMERLEEYEAINTDAGAESSAHVVSSVLFAAC